MRQVERLTTTFLTYALALAALGSWSVVAQPTPLPAGPIELSGTLEVIQVCYPAQNQSERWYEVLEDKSGQRHRLRFDVPPAQTHLTGERVRVRGYRQDGLIHVLAAPPQDDQGLEVLAAASPQTKGLTPTPTPMSWG